MQDDPRGRWSSWPAAGLLPAVGTRGLRKKGDAEEAGEVNKQSAMGR